jgi:hypothetical protein
MKNWFRRLFRRLALNPPPHLPVSQITSVPTAEPGITHLHIDGQPSKTLIMTAPRGFAFRKPTDTII